MKWMALHLSSKYHTSSASHYREWKEQNQVDIPPASPDKWRAKKNEPDMVNEKAGKQLVTPEDAQSQVHHPWRFESRKRLAGRIAHRKSDELHKNAMYAMSVSTFRRQQWKIRSSSEAGNPVNISAFTCNTIKTARLIDPTWPQIWRNDEVGSKLNFLFSHVRLSVMSSSPQNFRTSCK